MMNNKLLPYQEAWIKSVPPVRTEFYIHRRIYKLRMSAIKCLVQCVSKDGAVVLAFSMNKEGAKTFIDHTVSVIEENFSHAWDKLGSDITIQRFEDIYAILFKNGSVIISMPLNSNEAIETILEKLKQGDKEGNDMT